MGTVRRVRRQHAYPGLAAARMLARAQDGMLSYQQARVAGLTRGQLHQLVEVEGWSRPFRGTYLVPEADPVRGRARAALHCRPRATVCGLTAARLHCLRGLPPPSTDEPIHLLTSGSCARAHAPGIELHYGVLRDGDSTSRGGIVLTSVARTVADLMLVFNRAEAVALLDAALNDGLLPELIPVSSRLVGRRGGASRLRWLADVDARAESPLESRTRLVLCDAELNPEALQYLIVDEKGRVVARADIAYPSRRLLIETDGAAYHGDLGDPAPLYRDRDRQNTLSRLGWRVLRFTWADITLHPTRVVTAVRSLLASPA